jgi:hypothetical protein
MNATRKRLGGIGAPGESVVRDLLQRTRPRDRGDGRRGRITGQPYGQRQRQSDCRFAHAEKPKTAHTEW